jgi:two-component system nitrogen regulation sensor histidine kinase GlnL
VVRDYDISIPEFRGDREQLIQAVLNIVAHNAAQALAERIAAGDALHRAAHPRGPPGHLRQAALSAGTGIACHRQRAWRARLDQGPHLLPAGVGREGGSGLGLTLAQTFVQQHHGMIECDSVPGRTDFKILIPLP